MTTPTDAGAGIPGELIAKSAKNPEKHHADPAYCSGADHSPDAGNFERALNLAARAMQRQFNAGGSEEDIEAAIWQHLGPAFEAKEREIERACADHANATIGWERERGLREAAEAKLAQAVDDEREACARIALPSVVPAEWQECDDWFTKLGEMKRIATAIRARSAARGET